MWSTRLLDASARPGLRVARFRKRPRRVSIFAPFPRTSSRIREKSAHRDVPDAPVERREIARRNATCLETPPAFFSFRLAFLRFFTPVSRNYAGTPELRRNEVYTVSDMSSRTSSNSNYADILKLRRNLKKAPLPKSGGNNRRNGFPRCDRSCTLWA